MGFTQIPEQAQRGRNKAVLSLDKNELTQTINVLQKVVTHLNSNPNALPKFPSHPPSVIPDFLTTRRQSSISPVTVITPSVAALQQRLGLDLGSGLGLGPVGTFSTESTRYNDNGSISSPFSSSSSMLAIPPIGPPSGSSRPGPIGRPRSPLNTNSMQGPLPGLQSQFGQLGFRSGEHGSGDLGTRGLDVGSLSLGHTGLPPVRVSTGQPIGSNGGNNPMQGAFPTTGAPDLGLGLDRSNDSLRNGAFQNQQGVGGGSGFSQGRPGTPGTPQGSRTPPGAHQQGPIGPSFSQGRPGTPGTPQGSRTPTSGTHQQGPIGPFTRQQSGNQSRPETPKAQAGGQSGTAGLRRVPEASSSWKGRWTTAVTEHNREVVNVMLYAAELDGLVGEEVHTGWLISSSKKLLNLWECCGYSRASEPALQVMHSQTTEFTMETMDIDHNAKMLLSLSAHSRDPGFVIALHSLAGESFFNYKGSIRIPDTGITALRKQAPTGLKLLHVVSLQPLGGPLKTSVAAALNGDVMVYDLSAAATAPTAAAIPKAHWKAHDTPISSLHRSAFAPALLTGASDGSVRLWDLKTKPSAPVRQFAHPSLKAITGLNMLDANTVSTASVDSAIFLWDIRSSSTPVFQVIPDTKPVVQMAASPKQEAIAITTRKGLYCLELSGPGGANSVLSPLTPLPPAGPCTDMKWNAKTRQIYCSGVDGAISVFGKVNY